MCDTEGAPQSIQQPQFELFIQKCASLPWKREERSQTENTGVNEKHWSRTLRSQGVIESGKKKCACASKINSLQWSVWCSCRLGNERLTARMKRRVWRIVVRAVTLCDLKAEAVKTRVEEQRLNTELLLEKHRDRKDQDWVHQRHRTPQRFQS